jgi:hypothetical protein
MADNEDKAVTACDTILCINAVLRAAARIIMQKEEECGSCRQHIVTAQLKLM